MDNTTCYCRNPQCALYGRMAPYAQLKFRCWHRLARFDGIVPILTMKLRWREMQAFHVLTTDVKTAWIGVLIQLGLAGETRSGRGMTNAIAAHLVTNQRPPPPMRGNMTKHPMFDLIPLPGPRRTGPDGARATDLSGELGAFSLPQPIATGLAPPASGRDEDRGGLRIRHLAPMPPPAPEGCDRPMGGVVIAPHTAPTAMVRWIVHPIGTNLAQGLVRKSVGPYTFRRPWRLGVPAPIGQRAHEVLLVRIHRNDRLPRTAPQGYGCPDAPGLSAP